MFIKIVVTGTLTATTTDGTSYVLVLKEKDGERQCIMLFDLDNIRFIKAAQQHTAQAGFPVAHSAVMDLLAIAGMQLYQLVIPGIAGDHFRTILHFQYGNRNVTRELMPSDALAMALYVDCPIIIDDDLLTRSNTLAVPILAKLRTTGPQTSSQHAENAALTTPSDKLPQA